MSGTPILGKIAHRPDGQIDRAVDLADAGEAAAAAGGVDNGAELGGRGRADRRIRPAKRQNLPLRCDQRLQETPARGETAGTRYGEAKRSPVHRGGRFGSRRGDGFERGKLRGRDGRPAQPARPAAKLPAELVTEPAPKLHWRKRPPRRQQPSCAPQRAHSIGPTFRRSPLAGRAGFKQPISPLRAGNRYIGGLFGPVK